MATAAERSRRKKEGGGAEANLVAHVQVGFFAVRDENRGPVEEGLGLHGLIVFQVQLSDFDVNVDLVLGIQHSARGK